MNKISIIILVVLVIGFILFTFLGNRQQSYGMLEGFANDITEKIKNVEKDVNKDTNKNTSKDASKDTNKDASKDTNKDEVNDSTSYDNYNHYDKSNMPTMFYGPNGTTAKVMNTHGDYVIIVSDKQGKAVTYNPKSSDNDDKDDKDKDKKTYHSKTGGVAVVYTNPKTNQKIINVTDVKGNTVVYSSTNTQTYDTTIDNKSSSIDKTSINEYNNRNENLAYETGFISGIMQSYIKGPSENVPAYPVNTSASNASNASSTSLNATGKYNPSLPKGIQKSMIPPGDEDLYILKSEVVPPVCPPCPPQIVTCPKNDTSQCPPCPPCARCPEPSFNCQKVPNYTAGQENPYLPVPVLSSFSSFGM